LGLSAKHPDVRAWKVASLHRVGRHIMGRVTYEEMAGYWPDASGDYAAFMNNLPQGRLLQEVANRRMGWLPDCPRRPGRGDSRPQERVRRRDHGSWRRRVRSGAIQARPDRRVPPGHPPSRPGERAAAVQGSGQAATRRSRRGQEFPDGTVIHRAGSRPMPLPCSRPPRRRRRPLGRRPTRSQPPGRGRQRSP
jgi:hypothetical protein